MAPANAAIPPRSTVFLLAMTIVMAACHPKDPQTTNLQIPTNDTFIQAVIHKENPTLRILNACLPFVLADSLHHPITYSTPEIFETGGEERMRMLTVGRVFGDEGVYALEVVPRDSLIRFYRAEGLHWKPIGAATTLIPVHDLRWEDLDGDGRQEILASTARNMNGNAWMEVYYRSLDDDSIHFAGELATGYQVRPATKMVFQSYEGSMWMEPSQTLYHWENELLIPIQELRIQYEREMDPASGATLEYYENESSALEGLKMKWTRPYGDSHPEAVAIWDSFRDRQ